MGCVMLHPGVQSLLTYDVYAAVPVRNEREQKHATLSGGLHTSKFDALTEMEVKLFWFRRKQGLERTHCASTLRDDLSDNRHLHTV